MSVEQIRCTADHLALMSRETQKVMQAAALGDKFHWSTPLPRPAGIYWRRTGGKTHTVEVVR